jgi:hypothetical protein
MGRVRVGEAAKGGQLITKQGQEWMGICTTSKKAGSPSSKKAGNKEQGVVSKIAGNKEQGVGLARISSDV